MSLLDKMKENFNKQPLIIKLLLALFTIAFIYDIVTGTPISLFFSGSLLLLMIAEFVNWFFYTDE